MKKITINYKVYTDVRQEVEISDEEYELLKNFDTDTFFKIEDKFTRMNEDYVYESFEICSPNEVVTGY